tara:strand:- start:8608 stop:9318 length:711 start_codon:yes stop_codon:yes gene_type:complete
VESRDKIIAIVPARGGSKRIPKKNLKKIGGKSLVSIALENALNSRYINKIVLSSDDDEILSEAQPYPRVDPIMRPKKIATDNSLAIDYVKHVLQYLSENDPFFYSIIVIIQPSSPFTLPVDIDKTLDVLIDSNADSAVTVMRLDHALHPYKMKVIKSGILHPYLEKENGLMAEHELPKIYVRNGSVYATRRYVVDSGKIIGSKCLGHIMPRARSLDINETIDYSFAKFIDRLEPDN